MKLKYVELALCSRVWRYGFYYKRTIYENVSYDYISFLVFYQGIP